MKTKRPIQHLIAYFLCLLCAGHVQQGYAQKNSGIFYTTIFAKTGPYSRLTDFGKEAQVYFLKDVDGDGKDDAVVYFADGRCQVSIADGIKFTDPTDYHTHARSAASIKPLMGDVDGDGKADLVFFDSMTGNWDAALSTSTSFSPPHLWATGNGVGSTAQFLADVNGDGKDDAILFFRTGLAGHWYVALSGGRGFGSFSSWITGFGNSADQWLTGDVDGDGKADAMHYTKNTGNWEVAISDGTKLNAKGVWKTGFGINATTGMVHDVDRDGKADIIYYHQGGWWVCYSTGTAFSANSHHWITGHRPKTMVSRGNKPEPEAQLIGSISGRGTGACAVSDGEWLYLENPDKGITVDAVQTDTWGAWGNQYRPAIGTYDAGDQQTLDTHIKMIHDAGFTYMMLDITNGNNGWVDSRAKKLIERIVSWNNNLDGNKHKMYFCISMGASRGFSGAAAAERCEDETKRTWIEFYEPYKDAYYVQDGKPLLVHFVEFPPNRTNILNFETSMPYFQKFTVRWMFNEVKDEAAYKNTYGWPLLYKGANPVGDEVMSVSPGFWNGVGNLTAIGRERGEFYRSLWVRLLEYNPKSVWLNSFNESWEHTSVEPAYLPEDVAGEFPDILATWTDYYGERMDNFYWLMTVQYNRLFMNKELFLGGYLQEKNSSEIFVVTEEAIKSVGSAKPHMAPVLLVPEGYIQRFEGTIINQELDAVGEIRKLPDVMPEF